MNNFCWKCHKSLDQPISFKSTCEHCFAYLHCCQGCKYYSPGKPNDCDIPGTDPIRDREGMNYCEEFKPIDQKGTNSKSNLDDISKRLFGD